MKAREFWIRDFNGEVSKLGKDGFRYGNTEISIWSNCIEDYRDFKNAIHVIEYSAYQTLEAKLEILKSKQSCGYSGTSQADTG